MSDEDLSEFANIVYHSAFNSHGFSPQFCQRYAELSGGTRPDAWARDEIRIDNVITLKVIEELGPDECGRGLTVAKIRKRYLPALQMLDTDGCEYPELNADKFVVHYTAQHLAEHGSLSVQDFDKLRGESRQLHLKIISRATLSPVSTQNRYSCLSQ